MAALSANNFCENREALYGVFDGDRNVEIPYLLQCTMSDILAEELQKTKNEEEYMINTFIVMQRSVVFAKLVFVKISKDLFSNPEHVPFLLLHSFWGPFSLVPLESPIWIGTASCALGAYRDPAGI